MNNEIFIFLGYFLLVFFLIRFFTAIYARDVAVISIHLFERANRSSVKINYYKEMIYSFWEIVFMRPFSFGKYAGIKREYFETLKLFADKEFNSHEDSNY